MSTSFSMDPSKEHEFKVLQLEGKNLAAEGKLKESLKKFELAKQICPTSKVLQRIQKLKDHIKLIGAKSTSDENESTAEVFNNAQSAKNSVSGMPQSAIKEPVHKVLGDIQNVEKSKISSTSELSPQSELKFKELKRVAKELSYEGRLEEAVKCFNKALKIYDCPKVKRYIQEIELAIETIPAETKYDPPPEKKTNENLLATADRSSKTSVSERSSSIEEAANETISKSRKYDEPSTKLSLSSSQTSYFSKGSVSDNEDKIEEVKKLYYEARDSASNGQLAEALKLLKKAQDIHYTEKVQKQIDRLEMSERKSSIVEAANEAMSKSRNYLEPSTTSLSSSQPSNFSKESVSDNEDKIEQVKELYYEARDMASDGELAEALKLLKKAQDIHYTQKVQKQIDRLKELLLDPNENAGGDEMVKISDDFSIFRGIYDKLYPYQREGVAWMWKLFKMRKGGVLGDDMGLGKTFQVIAFLSGMIDTDQVKHVLIIMPVSLITNWEKEFKKWCPGISVHSFHGGSKKERARNLLRVQRRGHVLLTSYGMLVSNIDSLTHCEECRFIWDYVILDEGHKIKNPTKTTKAVHDIPARNRLVLTGTPIQNNLKELWSLYDFVQHGTLLGSLKTFKLQYENPITRSREKDATSGEKHLGTEMAENLKSLIKPYFLRRTKDEIWGNKSSDGIDQLENQMGNMKLMSRKNDLILWMCMSEKQIEIYKSFLHSDAVKSILVSKRSPLVELTILKKICDHPRLLSKRACLQLGLDGKMSEEDLIRELDDESSMASTIENVSDKTLLQESGKLNLVITLLEHLKESGHRTLIFSLSRKILDMLHRILANKNWKVMRLDGTITKREERERRIQRFQNDSRYPVFLITTQVGGVGITLTAADRVIIYDPSWNPATDAQAVDRVYRIGQQKNVVIYRLITCGTVEEKIYRRQVFKDSITRQTTTSSGSADPYRYFSHQQLRELFTIDDPYTSQTQIQLSEIHSAQRNTDNMLDDHIEYLKSLDIFGISDHDLMFTKEIKDQTEDNDEAAISYDYIKKQVATAHELIQKEASVVAEGMEAAGAFHRPYQETIPFSKKGAVKDTYKPPVIPDVVDLTEDAKDVHFNPPITPDIIIVKETKSPKYSNEEEDNIGSFEVTPKNKRHSVRLADAGVISYGDKIIQSALNEGKSDFPFYKTSPDLEFVLANHNKVFEVSEKCDLNEVPPLEEALTKEDEPMLSPITSDDSSPLKNNYLTDFVQNKSLLETEKLRDYSEELPETSNALEVSKYQKLTDLTGILDDDLNNLSLLDEESNTSTYLKKNRKSCARKSIFISDSDTSQQDSCPPSLNNSSAQLVEESDNADSDSADSSNSASLSFIPDSVPSTPLVSKKDDTSRYETPLDYTPVKSGSISFLKKQSDSVRRITPLKVNRSLTKLNSSFAKALAASPILSPQNSPEANKKAPEEYRVNDNTPQSSANNVSLVAADDTPIKFRRKNANRIASDSEDSGPETSINKSKVTPINMQKKKLNHVDTDSDETDAETSIQSEVSRSKMPRKQSAHISSDSEESDAEAKIKKIEQSLLRSAGLVKQPTKPQIKKVNLESDSEESEDETKNKPGAVPVEQSQKEDIENDASSEHSSALFSGQESGESESDDNTGSEQSINTNDSVNSETGSDSEYDSD